MTRLKTRSLNAIFTLLLVFLTFSATLFFLIFNASFVQADSQSTGQDADTGLDTSLISIELDYAPGSATGDNADEPANTDAADISATADATSTGSSAIYANADSCNAGTMGIVTGTGQQPIQQKSAQSAVADKVAEGVFDVNYVDSYAYSDFYVYSSTGSASVCTCSSYTDLLRIVNPGLYGSIYTLSSDSGLIIFSEQRFELQPGESKDVFVFLSIPCSFKAGEHEIDIIIKSNLGPQKIVTKKLDVNKCQNLKILLTAYNSEITPCEKPLNYSLIVENTGGFEEQYSVDLGRYSKWAETTTSSFVLLPGQKKQVLIKLNLPCDVYGTQIIPFNVRAERNGLSATVYHNLTVSQDYGYSLFTKSNKVICSGEETAIPVGIENKVNVPNNYSLNIKGASFLSLAGNFVALEGFGADSIIINAHPSKRHVGIYNVSLFSKTKIGDTENRLDFVLEVANCHSRDVLLPVSSEKFCVQSKEYELIIKNNGIVDEAVELLLEAPEFITIDSAQYYIPANSEKSVAISVDPPDEDGKYYARITAKFADGQTFTKQLAIDVLSEQSCYLVELSTKKVNIDVEDTEFALKILNKAFIDGASYTADIDAPSWITLRDSELSFGNQSHAYLIFDTIPDDSVQAGSYNMSLSLINDQSMQQYDYNIVVSLHEKPYIVLVWRYLSASLCRMARAGLMLAVFLFAVILIIQGGRLFRRRNMRNWRQVRTPKKPLFASALLLMFIIVAVAAIIVVPFRSMYSPIAYTDRSLLEEDEILYEWPEDLTLRIILSEYFNDPDNDVLRFTSTSPKNMTVSINGNIASVKPDKDWFGYRTIVFTASDLRGGVTESPFITLHVIEREDFTFWNVISFYCWYVNLAIFFAVLLLLYLVVVCQARINALEKDRIERRDAMRVARFQAAKKRKH
ncbi:MAG: hypothetical protein V1659_03815 [Candidatus Woesearchaeota archaeon]